MSHTPHYDAKIKTILDASKPGERICSLSQKSWTWTQEERSLCQQFHVPPSSVDPFLRMKYLLGFGTGVSIWWNKHAYTGQPLLSYIHPDNPLTVISDKEWSNSDFRQDEEIRTDQPFFDQMWKLAQTISSGAMLDDGTNINCLSVDAIHSRDCFMVFGGFSNTDLTYAAVSFEDEQCVDIVNTANSRRCFSTNHIQRCYACHDCFETNDCLSSGFLFDCHNCEYCFGATNKRHKKYLWFNEQLSKEEWETRRKTLDLSSYRLYKSYQQRFFTLVRDQAVWPSFFHMGSEQSTGEYLMRCVRAQESFWLVDCQDVFRCWSSGNLSQCAFVTWSGKGEGSYMTCNGMYIHGLKYCLQCWRSSDLEYCFNCHECEYCFGCVGLMKKQYCIFNKQYSEEAYWQKVDELKCAMLDRGEYGEFFPACFSQPGFCFSLGQVFLGYSEQELKTFHAPLFDPAKGNVFAPQQIDASHALTTLQIPDVLKEAKNFVGKPIFDPMINRPYSVLPKEYAFYEEYGLPFPQEHFLSRLQSLIRTSNTPHPEQSICAQCCKEISIYTNQIFEDRRILCQVCYLSYLEKNG